MTMGKFFIYRAGNGNEGNYPQFAVSIPCGGLRNPAAALKALVCNRYIPGTRTRAYVSRAFESDAFDSDRASGVIYEGPHRETEFGAAWLTAELEPMSETEFKNYPGHTYTLRDALDIGARRIYRNAGGVWS